MARRKSTTRPLGGPLDTSPTPALLHAAKNAGADDPTLAAKRTARGMLAAALDGVDLGEWDRDIHVWLCGRDIGTTATVASIMWRAREAARAAAGRAVSDVAAAVADAEAALSDPTADCRTALYLLAGRCMHAVAPHVPEQARSHAPMCLVP